MRADGGESRLIRFPYSPPGNDSFCRQSDRVHFSSFCAFVSGDQVRSADFSPAPAAVPSSLLPSLSFSPSALPSLFPFLLPPFLFFSSANKSDLEREAACACGPPCLPPPLLLHSNLPLPLNGPCLQDCPRRLVRGCNNGVSLSPPLEDYV